MIYNHLCGYISANKSIAVSFFVYENTTLFLSPMLANKSQDEDEEVKRIVASRVISATVEGIEVKNLPEDNFVETLFVLNKVSFEADSIIRARCQPLLRQTIQTHIHTHPHPPHTHTPAHVHFYCSFECTGYNM